MVRASIRDATELQRKSFVPENDRTPSRDEVADWIEANVVNGDDDWPDITMTEIADRVNVSREHVSKVLDIYFDPADTDPEVPPVLQSTDVPEGGGQFAAGYRSGYWDGLRDALEHDEELREWLQA